MSDFEAIDAIPVVSVADYPAALRFYVNVLGFAKVFEVGAYAGLELGRVMVHVGAAVDAWSAYPTSVRIDVRGVDAYYAKIRERAVIKADEQLKDMPFGMRQFSVLDPSGNRVTFAQAIAR